MYLIVGLGNPDKEYEHTRHNMGFDTIDIISKKYNIELTKTKFTGLYGSGVIDGEKVILLKPQTYMNLSGDSVVEYRNFFNIENENVIVIYDDTDIEKGIIKIRKKGGPGNHNGMKSIVERLGTEKFPRIRVGLGQPEYKNDMINFVIGKISKEEYDQLHQGIEKAAEAIPYIIKNGIDKAMNLFN